MRVLLVHPCLFRHPGPATPSGLVRIAGELRTLGITARILDLAFVWNRSTAIPEAVAAARPDAVGIGIPFLDNGCAYHPLSFLPQIRWIVERVRSATRAPVVAGGSGFALYPEDALTYLGLRIGDPGSDARGAARLLAAVAEGEVEASNAYRIRWDGGGYAVEGEAGSEPRGPVAPSAHDLVDYRPHLRWGGAVPVTVRARSPQEVADEVVALRETGRSDRVLFPGLELGGGGAHEVLEALAARPRGSRFELYARPASIDRDTVELLAAAGCAGVRFRRSHAHPVLERRAGGDPDGLRVALAALAGRLPTLLEVTVGRPGETPALLARGFEHLAGLPPPRRIHVQVGIRRTPGDGLGPLDEEGARGPSPIWPRFYVDPALGPDVIDDVRRGAAPHPTWHVDTDAYAPWYRRALGLERRFGPWPSWRAGPWTGLPGSIRVRTAALGSSRRDRSTFARLRDAEP